MQGVERAMQDWGRNGDGDGKADGMEAGGEREAEGEGRGGQRDGEGREGERRRRNGSLGEGGWGQGQRELSTWGHSYLLVPGLTHMRSVLCVATVGVRVDGRQVKVYLLGIRRGLSGGACRRRVGVMAGVGVALGSRASTAARIICILVDRVSEIKIYNLKKDSYDITT